MTASENLTGALSLDFAVENLTGVSEESLATCSQGQGVIEGVYDYIAKLVDKRFFINQERTLLEEC